MDVVTIFVDDETLTVEELENLFEEGESDEQPDK